MFPMACNPRFYTNMGIFVTVSWSLRGCKSHIMVELQSPTSKRNSQRGVKIDIMILEKGVMNLTLTISRGPGGCDVAR
ncbi:Uncharacterized protein TCM_014826 [Theobroma cacao]|uniref:Uncharacterized protein n=1 Tax=Theobroma cacao TaxID=3641 RepID=A0A061FZ14_THECC|nr:Uncharacterized protein TCM_014826 [Theobroma cacao]